MNYTGTGRSNYVKVTDPTKLKLIAAYYNLSVREGDEGRVCILAMNEGGDMENSFFVETEKDFDNMIDLGILPANTDREEEDVQLPEFDTLLKPLLMDEEIFIWKHTGSEGSRYLSGWGYAMSNTGETISISLDDIDAKASERWPTAKITDCSY
jgi:hypothetical protein